jgi:hypothetical protein
MSAKLQNTVHSTLAKFKVRAFQGKGQAVVRGELIWVPFIGDARQWSPPPTLSRDGIRKGSAARWPTQTPIASEALQRIASLYHIESEIRRWVARNGRSSAQPFALLEISDQYDVCVNV